MLTWDSEAITSFKQLVNTVHGPDTPFCMAQMVRDLASKQVTTAKAYFGTALEHLHRMKRQSEEAQELYMAVGLTRDENYTVQNFNGSWAVGVDFDNGLHELCKPGQPLAPTLTIETSPGRFHCIWVLDKFMTPEEMNRLAKAMADRLGGDMAFARVNQMIRVPGYVNQKYGEPVLMRHDLANQETYEYAWLWKAIDADLYEAGVKAMQPKLNHTTKNALRDKPEIVLKHLESALDHLKTRGHAEKYEDWIKTMLNLAPLGTQGHDLALRFSQDSAKFDQREFERKWENLQKTNTGSISTVFAMAQQEGWSNPGWSEAEGGESSRAPSEREFGFEIAREMVAGVAAIEPPEVSRQKLFPVFYEWNGILSLTPLGRQSCSENLANATFCLPASAMHSVMSFARVAFQPPFVYR